jgi:hypothetical protein
MALTDEGMGTTMLMQPAYGAPYGNNGGFGFGGDWAWILLLLVLGGGWGGFGMGGFGGAAMAMDGGFGLYPWLNNSQNINDGFRDQMLNSNVTSIRDGIQGLSTQLCQCCGDMRYDMSNGFNGVNNSIFGAQTAISQQLNSNELASLNRSFAEQTANMQGFNGVQSCIADLRYTEATEACATRNASAQNTRDIIDSQTRGTQAILDKLCALELDGVKGQLAQAQRENVALQNAVNMATMQASQVQQTADIINGTYTRLSQCPVSSTPVYGNQPIFTCPQTVATNNCGCGCGNNF